MLEIVGLPDPLEVLYRLLCAQGTMTAAAIEEAMGRPVESDLSELKARGYVFGDDPYTPSPPDLAAAAPWTETQHALWRAQQEIHDLMKVWRNGSARRAFEQDYIEVIEGAEVVQQRFAQLQQFAQNDLKVMVTYPPSNMTPPPGDESQQRATLRGVTYRVLLQSDYITKADEPARKEIAESESFGEEIRCLDDIPFKGLIADRQMAFLSLPTQASGSGPQAESGILIRHLSLVSTLDEYFMLLWERASPLQVTQEGLTFRRKGDDLTALDKDILRHLINGTEDATIAKFVSRDARTVKRRINDMMKILDVKTRAQLGYEVAKSDLLSK